MSSPELELTHRQEFSAAHRLHDPTLGDEENAQLYGPCNNPNGHGHTYVYEVTVRGQVPPSGMIIDLNVLRAIMREEIFDQVDHKHLDLDVPFMEGRISTAENLAIAFWECLAPRINDHPGCRLHRLRVHEGPDSHVDYFGPPEQ
jgi:6-pyruvoyltetrahydropterin/6-carboxytetrahydropterin synthase